MKLNFRKISAVLGSTLLAGLTLGVAHAAYPSPFVENGVADVGIVYGTGAGVSALDQTQAGNIQASLATFVTGSVVIGDGDSFKFEKTSTKYHLGDNITGVISSNLDEDQLPTLLAPGKYIDDDNDEIDYTQKIQIGAANQLTMFEDNDYKEDEPTIGFRIPNAQNVLTYTLTFDDTLLVTDMPTTDLPIMDKSYYVLSNTSTTLTLLDSAASATVQAGETVTLDVSGATYVVSVSIFDTANSKVKLLINGETTNLLGATETQKLSDGAYVGVKEVIVQNFQGGTNQVEFSIGSGKLKITSGSDVQINDEAISGLVGTITRSENTITAIALAWATDDDMFVTEDSAVTMPGFETVSLSFGGLTYPAEEVIEVSKGGTTYATLENFPLKDAIYDINILYGDSTSFEGLGKDSNNRLVVSSGLAGTANITYDRDDDDYFVVSWSDTNDAESYLVRLTNFITESDVNKTDVQYRVGNAWVTKKAKAKTSDTISLGNSEFVIYDIHNGRNDAIVATGTDTVFNKLYSKEGMTVYLPWLNSTAVNITNNTEHASAAAACAQLAFVLGEVYTGQLDYNLTSTLGVSNTAACATTFPLVMFEEDKSENKYVGDWLNITLGWDSSSPSAVEVTGVATSNTDAPSTEILETNVYRDFIYSALATEILWEKPDSGQNSLKLIYHGDEVAADVYITSAGALTSSGTLGDVLFTDAEKSSWEGMNVIIVGGSCINSAAATALGVSEHTCGATFTAATGVGSGEFLIKGVQDAFTSGKLALVVAGYDAADTVNAATYFRTQSIDSSKEYKGTTATSAELVVA